MNFFTIILLAFIFGLTYSAAVDIYESIKTRVKNKKEKKKNDNTPSDVL